MLLVSYLTIIYYIIAVLTQDELERTTYNVNIANKKHLSRIFDSGSFYGGDEDFKFDLKETSKERQSSGERSSDS